MDEELVQRFVAKVAVECDCHRWLGGIDSKGYGRFWVKRKNGLGPPNYHRAHRIAWLIRYGASTDGLVIDHLCGNKWCVNTDHMEEVTSGENVGRAVRLAVCRKGLHDMTDDANVQYDAAGRRRGCLPCRLERDRVRALARYHADGEESRQRQRTPAVREARNARRRLRYAEDVDYRERMKTAAKNAHDKKRQWKEVPKP